MKKLLSYIKNSAFLPICAGIATIQPQLSAQIQELYFNDEFDRMIFTMKIIHKRHLQLVYGYFKNNSLYRNSRRQPKRQCIRFGGVRNKSEGIQYPDI